MARLESEAFLLGMWKNIEEMEDSISLDELEAILRASREKQHEHNKFLAALKGINLDEEDEVKERFAAVERRAAAKLSGRSEESLEFEELGIDVETG